MKYRDFYIDETEMSDVLRKTAGEKIHCKGICFQIYADHDYEIQIGEFTGAYGYEIDESRESVLQFVRKHIDENMELYRTKQFYSLIEKDFKDFDYDIHQYPEEYDVLESAEKISNMNKAYMFLMKYKPVNVDDMHRIVTLKRPLETICAYFSQDETEFVKEFCETISHVAKDNDNIYGYVSDDEGEEEILDADADEIQELTMQ